jgi:hypothetical protein
MFSRGVLLGGVLVEKAIIDAYTYGETCLEENRHTGKERYAFHQNWPMKKNSSYEKALFQNVEAYMKGKETCAVHTDTPCVSHSLAMDGFDP